jgi:hypothetical protein
VDRHLRPRRVLLMATLVATGLGSSAARAADSTKAQCVSANLSGQDLRRDGKLAAAREAFRQCADPSCPALVRDDCTRRLDEIERVQPTIVFEAKDASGHDQSAVVVTLDGKPLAERLSGAALQVDPGEHVFAFTVSGQAPVTQTFVIREGERDRRERVVLGPAAPSPPPVPVQAPAASPPAETIPTPAPAGSSTAGSPLAADEPTGAQGGLGTQRILGITAGGLGIAAVVVGSVFGALTSTAINQQKADCSPGGPAACPNRDDAVSQHSTAMTDGAISTAAFIAGGVFLATGGVLFFSSGSRSPGSTALVVAPRVGSGSAALSVQGSF